MANTIFAHAYEKGIDIQPRKTYIVASLVRDRYVSDAIVILENTPRKVLILSLERLISWLL